MDLICDIDGSKTYIDLFFFETRAAIPVPAFVATGVVRFFASGHP